LAESQASRVPSGKDSAYGAKSRRREPDLAEQALVCGPGRDNGGSPMANPPQEVPAVSGEWHNMALHP